MGKIIRLTESDLARIIKRVISEKNETDIEEIFSKKVLKNRLLIARELENDVRDTLDKIEGEMREMFPEYYKIKVGFSGINKNGQTIYSIYLRAYLTPEDFKDNKELRANQIIKTMGSEDWGFRYM